MTGPWRLDVQVSNTSPRKKAWIPGSIWIEPENRVMASQKLFEGGPIMPMFALALLGCLGISLGSTCLPDAIPEDQRQRLGQN